MSATNRGGDRVASDNYPTPPWCTRRILEALDPTHRGGPMVLEPCVGEGAILEVVSEYYEKRCTTIGCDIRETPHSTGGWDATKNLELGNGFDLLITNPPFSLAAEIILAQRDTARVCAYLLRSSFKLEKQPSEQQLRSVDGRGAYGARDEFFYSFRDDMPDVFQLPERPSFIASDRCGGGSEYLASGEIHEWIACDWGQKVPLTEPRPQRCPNCGAPRVTRSTSDASEYAWFVWTSERRSAGRLVLLPSTPLSERKAR